MLYLIPLASNVVLLATPLVRSGLQPSRSLPCPLLTSTAWSGRISSPSNLVFRTDSRSSEESLTVLSTQPPDLQPEPLMDLASVVICRLLRRRMPRISLSDSHPRAAEHVRHTEKGRLLEPPRYIPCLRPEAPDVQAEQTRSPTANLRRMHQRSANYAPLRTRSSVSLPLRPPCPACHRRWYPPKLHQRIPCTPSAVPRRCCCSH